MSRSFRRVTDPERIRALAHPLRLELLEFLHDVPQATATECADRLGESVASCSFHLRMLEKYGYIERAERRGREKPWRAVIGGWDLHPDAGVPGSVHAVAELAVLYLAREEQRIRTFFAQADREPEEWLLASTLSASSFWATVEEMTELSSQIQALTERFADRSDNPALRPAGARQGRLFATVNPDPQPPVGPDPQPAATPDSQPAATPEPPAPADPGRRATRPPS